MPSNTPFLLLSIPCFLVLLQSVGIASGDLPETITLPASDPVATYSVDGAEFLGQGGYLSFSITPVYHSPEEAAAFLQGAGVSLAFVGFEGENFLAVYGGSNPEENEWTYVQMPEHSGLLSMGIHFDEQSQYHILLDGLPVLGPVTRNIHSSELLIFYGDSTHPITVNDIVLSLADKENKFEAESKREAYLSTLANAQTLRDIKWRPRNLLCQAPNGAWFTADALFNKCMENWPKEILDKPLNDIIFIDNIEGNDNNNGHYPLTISDVSGPVKTMDQALKLSGEGKVLIFLPGNGYYSAEHIAPKKGTEMILSIGNTTLASTADDF